jgi:hypothetical protein
VDLVEAVVEHRSIIRLEPQELQVKEMLVEMVCLSHLQMLVEVVGEEQEEQAVTEVVQEMVVQVEVVLHRQLQERQSHMQVVAALVETQSLDLLVRLEGPEVKVQQEVIMRPQTEVVAVVVLVVMFRHH